MKSIFDKHKIGFDCPKCGHGISETIRKLKTSPDLNCPACGTTISIDADDFARGVRDAEKQIEDFRKGLGGTRKRLKF